MKRKRSGNEAEFEVSAQCLRVQVEVAVFQQRRQRPGPRRESKRASTLSVVKRLDAHPVAREKESALLSIPHGEREHPVQPLQAFWSPRPIRFDQRLRVGIAEPTAAGQKLHAERAMVVDLAIEDDNVTPVRGLHRLMTGGGKLDDGEAPMAETNETVVPSALVVGSTTPQPVQGQTERLRLGGNARRVENA